MAVGRPRRAQAARGGGRRRHARAPRHPRAAARVGDRQALEAGLQRRGPRARRRRLVPRADRAPAAGPPAAARAGQQHRVVELPDERAGPRRARAVPGRQRGGGQDPVAGRLPHPHPGARGDEAGRPAGEPAVRRRRGARRRAHQLARDRRAGLRRRARQRPQGRHDARRHRQAAPARAGGPQRLGRLGLLRLGRPRRAPHQGLRVRQAALHRLPALRRAARAVPGVPRDVPAGGEGPALRPPAGGRGRRTTTCPTCTSARSSPAARPPSCGEHWAAAVSGGGIPLYEGTLAQGRFLDGQDTSRVRRARAACSSRRRAGRCGTPSRSGRSTRSCWSTPRPSCSRR